MTTAENTGEHPPSTPREATFGMKRAAEVAGVSVSTIRRNKELLRQHGAVLDPDGWRVPMSALIASGLMRRTTPPDPPAQTDRGAEAPTEGHVPERIRELERETMELRHRAELAEERQRTAEAVARERGEALEDARTALRMLTAGPAATVTAAVPAEDQKHESPAAPYAEAPPGNSQNVGAAEKPGSWWKRLFG